MAGLLAARVLADHFDQVTLVERDALTDSAQTRKGVPQGHQLHVLLPRGLAIAERLFPGYGHELKAAGAVSVRVPSDALILTPAGWLDRRATGWSLLSASRPLFEWAVRRRLRELPGVTILDRHDVTSLLTSHDGRRVSGVTLRPLDDAASTHRQLDADLVADASGRGSRAPTWLSEGGYGTPTKTHVDPNIAYASRIYRIPDGFSADWQLVMLASQPPSIPRTGFLFPIEDRQWMVALIGAAGQHPPTDEDGFTAFTRGLRHPIIADVLATAEPLTPIRGHRGTANRLWHYERMRRWPERFVVLGDAVCAFNPIYGQGMSTAAIATETLDACLREHQRRRRQADDLDGLARRFQRRLARRTADPWMLSTGEDLRYPTTTGARDRRDAAAASLPRPGGGRCHPGSRHRRHLHAGPWPARPPDLAIRPTDPGRRSPGPIPWRGHTLELRATRPPACDGGSRSGEGLGSTVIHPVSDRISRLHPPAGGVAEVRWELGPSDHVLDGITRHPELWAKGLSWRLATPRWRGA